MKFEGYSAMQQAQSQDTTPSRKRRIKERMKGHLPNPQAESPTLAYSIVYFTTVALLLTLCMVASFR